MKVDILSLITGIIFVIGGVVFVIVSFFVWFFVICGAIILILGIVILLTLKEQDSIELVKKEIKGVNNK